VDARYEKAERYGTGTIIISERLLMENNTD